MNHLSAATGSVSEIHKATSPRWTAAKERTLIRTLHLILSIPILGYLYGPVAQIPVAAFFVCWIAMPVVILTGFWFWLKPRIKRWLVS